jgi:hypothetical protein
MFYMAELKLVAGAEPASTRPWRPGLAGRATAALCVVHGHHDEKGNESDESDIWEGFLVLKRDGGSANSGNRRTSRLESFYSDAESNAGLDLNAARRTLTMCLITAGQSLSLVDGTGFQSFVRALNPLVPVSCSILDRDLMTPSGREKDALHSIISETSGGLSFAVDKWRSQETGDNYNDDTYLCVTAYFVDASWKLQRRIVGFKFMQFPDDVTSVAEITELCFSELKIDKKVIGITLDNDTLHNVEYEASMPDSLKTVLHDKCKVLSDGEFCQVHCFTDILNFAVRAATREIAKTYLEINLDIAGHMASVYAVGSPCYIGAASIKMASILCEALHSNTTAPR